MPRKKIERHRAEGEIFFLTFLFIGLGDYVVERDLCASHRCSCPSFVLFRPLDLRWFPGGADDFLFRPVASNVYGKWRIRCGKPIGLLVFSGRFRPHSVAVRLAFDDELMSAVAEGFADEASSTADCLTSFDKLRR